MADTVQRIYQLIIDAGGSKQGADQFAQAMGVIDSASQKAGNAGRTLAQLERANTTLTRSIDPTVAAQQKMASALQTVAESMQKGVYGIDTAQQKVEQITLKWDAAAQAAKRLADAQGALAVTARQEAAQAAFSNFMGISPEVPSGFAASQSAAVFQPLVEAEDRLKSFTARYEPLVAATKRYNDAIAANTQMLKAGEITAEQYANALKVEQTALDSVAASQKRAASTGSGSFFGLNNIGRMELQASAINFVQGVASGISPLRMLETEVPQVFGAFIQGGKLTLPVLLGVGGAIAAVAGSVGALFVAYEKGASQTASFNAALRITADSSGMTRDALEGMVASVTKFGQLGPSTARAIATEMTASGKLSSDVIGKLLSITNDYARATGEDAAKAGASLTKMFADPQQALKQLDDAYNLLSSSQRQHIEDLIAEGQKTQAQIELADALGSRFRRLATDDMGFLEKSWAGLSRAASDAWDAMVGLGRGDTLEQQLTKVKAEIAELNAQKQDQSNALLGQYLPFSGQQRLDQLNGQAADLTSKIDADKLNAQMAQQAADLRDLGKQADDAAKGYDAFITKQKDAADAVQKWTDALAKIKAGLLTAEDKKSIDELTKAAKDAQDALAGAIALQNSLRSPEQEALDKLSIARRVASAPPSQRSALQARLTAEDQARHNPNADVQGNASLLGNVAATEATLQQTTAIRDQNTQLDLNAKLTLATGEAWMKSSTEGTIAAARQQAAVESLTQPINVNARTTQILTQQVNESIAAGAQQVRSLDEQVTAQQRLAAAAKDGPLSERQAQVTNQIAAATKDLNDKLQLAFATKNTKAVADLQAEIAATAEKTRELDAAAQQYAQNHWLAGTLADQGYQKQLLQVQLDNVFANDNQQTKALAIAQAMVEIEKRQIPLEDERAQAILRNAAALADMNVTLTQQKAIAAELPNAFNQAFDRIGQAVTQFAVQGGDAFKSLENIGNAVFSELLQEGLKLALINPVKNWFNGDNALPTMNSLFDHYTGSNFGGSNSQVGVRNQSSGGFDLSSGGGGNWLASIGSGIGSWLGSLFADGGVMTSRGRLPLRTYSDGGITSSPQLAMFGEGSTPEAYVPVPSGRIPVEIRNFQPNPAANGNWQPVITQHLHFHTKEAVNQFRQSPGQTMNAAYRSLMAAGARN